MTTRKLKFHSQTRSQSCRLISAILTVVNLPFDASEAAILGDKNGILHCRLDETPVACLATSLLKASQKHDFSLNREHDAGDWGLNPH